MAIIDRLHCSTQEDLHQAEWGVLSAGLFSLGQLVDPSAHLHVVGPYPFAMPGQILVAVNRLSLLALSSIVVLGAFSRLTRGRYTPSFYAYQTDRAPDENAARMIPFVDLTLGSLLLLAKTRGWAALVGSIMQAIGILHRLQDDKSVGLDAALLTIALLATASSFARGRR